jgi:cyclase
MRWLILAPLLIGAPAAAQPDLSRVEVRVERLAPGVAVLFGAGGNIGVSYGEDGNVLIDDQYAPLTERIVAAVATLDPDPIRFVINTHWHGDHVGGNEALGGRGAVIVAHDNVRRRMSAGQMLRGRQVPPSPRGALPVVTFAEGVTFHLNGDTIRVVHVANAHTDGDAFIRWTGANVLHMGDTYFNGTLPFIDLESGGSVDGLIAALDLALGMTDERTRIIPGHGPVASRSDLVSYRNLIRSVRDRVAAEIAAGRSLDQVQALGLADTYGSTSDFIPPRTFIASIYNSLRAAASHDHQGGAHRH